MSTYTRVKTSGEVMTVPVSDFKPADLAREMTHDAEALIIKNKETLGVYMTVEHRNELAERLDFALLTIDMMAAGATWESIKHSAAQVADGKTYGRQGAKERMKTLRRAKVEA